MESPSSIDNDNRIETYGGEEKDLRTQMSQIHIVATTIQPNKNIS